ncbi:hypothetical protein GCM10010112_29170 [Actinoplanes lobatus]|uniref:Uncharacterized protein n=1 Tax=Actinoplanes lobatus TaxID=113568 RepID=A0A7W7HQI8_9ACTN|nr:hypothetical protein [Actinoplanes lobatus]MBB4754627.1 hypothetical protein [Actinoplanes lobatus]GGN66612.1 hypothetical protein GCM10010112_29170 [Actinoplanes lobatus]GIE42521.1 hypothetical protein Alo02nite_54190 [Actinoplanes lobatus]
MTNSIGSSAPSVTSRASALFGGAKDAFRAIADAAVSTQDEAPVAEAAKKGRQGTVLDRYA